MLARGLSYYTGAIFEVKALGVSLDSVSGGGRYDNLTGVFGLEGVSGVGISFGVDRIYDVMEELKLFPETTLEGTQVLITFFDQKGFQYGLKLAAHFRANGISTEIYPEEAKIKKQFIYADKKNIPWVIILGDDEIQNQSLSLKNLKSGTQVSTSLSEACEKILGK
jgi:histidyl-tRNA synthetase